MSRHNLAFLTGAVIKAPIIHKNDEGDILYGMCNLNVVRGYRDVGDNKNFMKSDNPIIMSREPAILQEMEKWNENDIVYIKGVIASKSIKKTSICQHCGAKNTVDGTLVYINPIFAKQIKQFESSNEAISFLSSLREISNEVYVLGTLCRPPKKITPKEGLVVTQYQIALNRKYFIRTDPPEIKADYPWVKSYGENALEDRKRLKTGAKVFIDGCLQARAVQRHIVCEECGQKYDWKDRALEIVPYETEYICGYNTDEDLAEQEMEAAKNAFASVFGVQENDNDDISEEDIDAGYDANAN